MIVNVNYIISNTKKNTIFFLVSQKEKLTNIIWIKMELRENFDYCYLNIVKFIKEFNSSTYLEGREGLHMKGKCS